MWQPSEIKLGAPCADRSLREVDLIPRKMHKKRAQLPQLRDACIAAGHLGVPTIALPGTEHLLNDQVAQPS